MKNARSLGFQAAGVFCFEIRYVCGYARVDKP